MLLSRSLARGRRRRGLPGHPLSASGRKLDGVRKETEVAEDPADGARQHDGSHETEAPAAVRALEDIDVETTPHVLGTEHEAKHLSAHDFRHAALTHMAAVGSDLTAIGHVAGDKNAITTALYVHNSEAAARRAVDRRAGILDTELDTVAGQAAENHPLVRPKFSESKGGPSWTRTRSQWIKNAPQVPESIEFFNDFASDIASRDATKRPETTLFGHSVQRENSVVPMENVHAAAAMLLHRVAESGEISITVLREFAELVLRSELVEASRQVLEGPPEFAVRRALELASLVLGVRVAGNAEKGKEGAG